MKIKKVKKVMLQTLTLQKQLIQRKPQIFLQQKLRNYKSQELKKLSLRQLASDQKKRKQLNINLSSSTKSQNEGLNIRLIRQRIKKFLNDQQATKVSRSKDQLSINDIWRDNSRLFLTQKNSQLKIKQKYHKKEHHSLQMLKRKLNMNQNKLRQQVNNSLMRRSLKIGDQKYPRKGCYPYYMFFNDDHSYGNQNTLLPNMEQAAKRVSKYQSNSHSESQSMETTFLIKRRKKQNRYLKKKQLMKINQIKDQSELIMINKKTTEENKQINIKIKDKFIHKKIHHSQVFEPWEKHHDQQFLEQNMHLA